MMLDALFEFMIVFTLGMILTYCFFMLQGRKSIVKNKIRGGELVAPKELTKYLKKHRIASSIKIGGLPIVKDSERHHILFLY